MTKAVFLKGAVLTAFVLGCKMMPTTDVPAYSGKVFQGKFTSLQTLSRNKIFLLNLWSTFCPPCLRELPMLEKINNKYSSNPGFAFMTLALNSEKEMSQFALSTDSSNPYRQVFKYSGLTRLDFPVIPGLTHGYILDPGKEGRFSATLGNNSEVEVLDKMFGMEGIPVTILYNSSGKVVYRQDGLVTDDTIIIRKIDSLLAKN